MVSNVINDFLAGGSNEECATKRASLYPHLLTALKECGVAEMESVMELVVADCGSGEELRYSALTFLKSVLQCEGVMECHPLRISLLHGAQRALSVLSKQFGTDATVPDSDTLFLAWSALCTALLKGGMDMKTVMMALCPPLKKAVESSDRVLVEGALGVWRSLTDLFCDNLRKHPSSLKASDVRMLVDLLVQPLRFMPHVCTQTKFEVWRSLANKLDKRVYGPFFDLVVIGLLRMAVGGMLEFVKEGQDVCDSLATPVTDHSALLVHRCNSKIVQQWMQEKMDRNQWLAERGLNLVASILNVQHSDANTEGGGEVSLSVLHFPQVPYLLLAGSLRIFSHYLAYDPQALVRVHRELEDSWAALCKAIIASIADSSQRAFALNHVNAHFIAWLNESTLPNQLVLGSYLEMCEDQLFVNGSSNHTIAHAFVAVYNKLCTGATFPQWTDVCAATLHSVDSSSDAMRLHLLNVIVKQTLVSPAHRQCSTCSVLWVDVAKVLIKHIDTTQEVNEGSRTLADHSTVDSTLLYPLRKASCSAQFNASESIKEVWNAWKSLYTSVKAANSREPNATDMSCAVRTANAMLSTIDTLPMSDVSLCVACRMLHIIVETFPFATMGHSIFGGGDNDPIEVLCKAMTRFGDDVIELLCKQESAAKTKPHNDHLMLALHKVLASLKLAIHGLSESVHAVSLMTGLSPLFAHLILLASNKQHSYVLTKSPVKWLELLKQVLESVQNNYSGPYCTNLLSKLDPLLVACYRHGSTRVRQTLTAFMRKTFAKATQLQCSTELRQVLSSMKGGSKLVLPLAPDTFRCIDSDSTVQHNDSAWNMTDLQDSVPPVVLLTPIRTEQTALKKDQSHTSSAKKCRRSPPFDDNDDAFQVIEPQSADKKMRLTERQKEKLSEKRQVTMYMNEDLSQSASRLPPVLPSSYVIESSQSAPSSQTSNQSQLLPTQPITESSAAVEVEGSPEVIEESPPRDSPRGASDIRKFLTPSAAVKRSPLKTFSASPRSRKSLPKRLRTPKKRWSPSKRVSSQRASADSPRKKSRLTACRSSQHKDEEVRKMEESIESVSQSLSQEAVEDNATSAIVEEVNVREEVTTQSVPTQQPTASSDSTSHESLCTAQLLCTPPQTAQQPSVAGTSGDDESTDVKECPMEGTPSILKKTPRDSSAQSPVTSDKKFEMKRVHFDVLQMDKELQAAGRSPNRTKRHPSASLFHTSQEKATSQETESMSEVLTPLRKVASADEFNLSTCVFPCLALCTDAIPPQFYFKLGGPRGLDVRNDFKKLGLLTVGSLARLSEHAVRTLPIKKPQVNLVRSVLTDFASSQSSSDSVCGLSQDSASSLPSATEEEKENDDQPFKLSEDSLLLAQNAIFEQSTDGGVMTAQDTENADVDAISAEAIADEIGDTPVESTVAVDERQGGEELSSQEGSTTQIPIEPAPMQQQPTSSAFTIPSSDGDDDQIRVSLDSGMSDETLAQLIPPHEPSTQDIRMDDTENVNIDTITQEAIVDGTSTKEEQEDGHVKANEHINEAPSKSCIAFEEEQGGSHAGNMESSLPSDAVEDITECSDRPGMAQPLPEVTPTSESPTDATEVDDDMTIAQQRGVFEGALSVVERMWQPDSETISTQHLMAMHHKIAIAETVLRNANKRWHVLLNNSFKH